MPRQGDEPVPGYRLQKRLGRGSFGEVWKASGPGGTQAALKFIALGDSQALREFRAIQRIKQIRHVHLMPLIGIWLIDQYAQLMDEESWANWSNPAPVDAKAPADVSDSRGTLQLPRDDRRPVELIEAMPLGDQDLLGRLADCKAAGWPGIPTDELLGYLEDAAKAIDFLNARRHDLGSGLVAITHGDIKPQNIMLVGGSAQVCDFGLARLLGGTQATSTALAGSPAYMAPESIRDKQPHRSTDQYSLAITYAELRTGLLPFYTQSYLEVLNSHLEGKLNLDTLAPAERAVIQRATALDPDQRYSTSLEMVHALQRAVAGAPPQSTSAGNEIPAPPVNVGHKDAARDLPRGTLASGSTSATTDDLAALPVTATPRDRTIRETEPLAAPLADVLNELSPSRSGNKLLAGLMAIALLVGAGGFGYWQFQPQLRELADAERITSSAEVEASSTVIETAAAPSIAETQHPATHTEPAKPQPAEKLETAPVSAALPVLTIVEAPEKIAAGETLRVVFSGSDPSGQSLNYQWRNVTDNGGTNDDWQTQTGVELELPDVKPGDLRLEFRAVNASGLASDAETRTWTVEPATQITNSLKMQLRLIPAGEFLMGSAESTAEIQAAFAVPEDQRQAGWANFDDERPQRRIAITHPFYLGTHEVTKAQFAEFVTATDYKTDAERDGRGGSGWDAEAKKLVTRPEFNWRSWGFDQTDDSPVVNVSWSDATQFCQWLSARDGRKYRLPTEAEWEYACRAGTATRFSSGDDPESLALVGNVPDAQAKAQIPEVAMSIAADDGHAFPAPVGSYQPNAWGLYDLHGNAWEWCSDWYDAQYYQQAPTQNQHITDPQGPDSGTQRVARGGGWLPYPIFCRASYRGWESPEFRSHFMGFRVAMDP